MQKVGLEALAVRKVLVQHEIGIHDCVHPDTFEGGAAARGPELRLYSDGAVDGVVSYTQLRLSSAPGVPFREQCVDKPYNAVPNTVTPEQRLEARRREAPQPVHTHLLVGDPRRVQGGDVLLRGRAGAVQASKRLDSRSRGVSPALLFTLFFTPRLAQLSLAPPQQQLGKEHAHRALYDNGILSSIGFDALAFFIQPLLERRNAFPPNNAALEHAPDEALYPRRCVRCPLHLLPLEAVDVKPRGMCLPRERNAGEERPDGVLDTARRCRPLRVICPFHSCQVLVYTTPCVCPSSPREGAPRHSLHHHRTHTPLVH
eukprot:PhM_4_TR16099/c0_g1_i1/m.90193